jgi:hypothetical protein
MCPVAHVAIVTIDPPYTLIHCAIDKLQIKHGMIIAY